MGTAQALAPLPPLAAGRRHRCSLPSALPGSGLGESGRRWLSILLPLSSWASVRERQRGPHRSDHLHPSGDDPIRLKASSRRQAPPLYPVPPLAVAPVRHSGCLPLVAHRSRRRPLCRPLSRCHSKARGGVQHGLPSRPRALLVVLVVLLAVLLVVLSVLGRCVPAPCLRVLLLSVWMLALVLVWRVRWRSMASGCMGP